MYPASQRGALARAIILACLFSIAWFFGVPAAAASPDENNSALRTIAAKNCPVGTVLVDDRCAAPKSQAVRTLYRLIHTAQARGGANPYIPTCPGGQTNCSNTCVDTQVDPNNCGQCGNVCAGGQVCTNGACGAPHPTTTTSLGSDINPSDLGQTVTFTATVTSGGGTPTGSVSFDFGDGNQQNAGLTSGVATATHAYNTTGDYTVGASYAGDGTFAGSSATISQHVNNVGATTITVASSLNPSTFGDAVTFTATMTPAGGAGAPTGTITFKDGGTPLDSGQIAVTTIGAGHTLAYAQDDAVGCAVTAAGGAKCWGPSLGGSLGNGDASSSNSYPTPQDVTGLGAASGVVAITHGELHGCVVLNTGAVKCWGANDAGQVGVDPGLNMDTTTPKDVAGISNVVAMTAGLSHTCALTAAGGVKCWGDDGLGQLGDNDNTAKFTPTAVSGLTSGVIAIAAAGNSTCAVLADGTVQCWGANNKGQIGDGTQTDRHTPVVVTGLTGATSLGGGLYHECATTTGTVKCWGQNDNGQLGNGTSGNGLFSATPVDTGLAAVMVAGGQRHTCAVTTSGGAKCWGYTASGRLGNGENDIHLNETTPVDVTGQTSNVVAVVAGNQNSCTQLNDGSLYCFGAKFGGALGDGIDPGTDSDHTLPVAVSGFGAGGSPVVAKAQFTTSDLVAATHTITATYDGDANFDTATSAGLSQVVNSNTKPVPVVTITSITPDGAYYGQQVSINVTVTSGMGTPTGRVTAKSGIHVLGRAPLSAGAATVKTKLLDLGPNHVKVTYPGDANFAPATSGVVIYRVKARTNMGVSAIVNPDQSIQMTATVTVAAPGTGDASGVVTFRRADNSALLGKATLSGGTATATTNPAKYGAFTIEASYPGNAGYSASSAAVDVSVSPDVGSQSRVSSLANTSTGRDLVSVARLSGTAFVAVYKSNGQDGDAGGIYGQRYSDAFAKAGVEFRVNTTTAGEQSFPKVATLLDGGFIVVWESDGQDTDGGGIYAQRYTSAGAKSGVEFRVNTRTISQQVNPAVTGLVTGGFAVVWTSQGGDSDGKGVVGQIYGSNSQKVGNEFLVNGTETGEQQDPAIAGLNSGDGRFVVVWRSAKSDNTGFDIMAKVYAGAGNTLKSEFKVNTNTTGDRLFPAVAANSDGSYVVVWSAVGQDAPGTLGLYGQRYSLNSAKGGGELAINTTTASDQSTPAIASYTDGGFVVLWKQDNGSTTRGIFGQAYKAAGTKVNSEFMVSMPSAYDQRFPSVIAFNNGTGVAMWTIGTSPAGNIWAQKFTVPGVVAP